MSDILVIKASNRGEEATSNRCADMFADVYQKTHGGKITEIDLMKQELPKVDPQVIAAWNTGVIAPGYEQRLAELDRLCEQFVRSDGYVFAFPNWNLMAPPHLVHYILCVMRAGKTFRYTENGSEGLLKNKRALIIMTSGGISDVLNSVTFSYGAQWLKGVLCQNGVTDVNVLLAQGFVQWPQEYQRLEQEALDKAAQLAKEF